MPEYIDILILFGVGNIASFINVMAGGGSTITLPVLIFLGLDSALANGTNRIGILLQNISGVASYRFEKIRGLKRSIELSAFTLPGAILGAVAAIRIDDRLFEIILAMVMIGTIGSMLLPGLSRSDSEITPEGRRTWVIYPVMFGIGFYGGFIQGGVGILIMAAFYHILKMNLVYVNMHKLVVVLIYTIPALLIFILTDNVDWSLGIALAAGNAFGAWWAARISVRSGEWVIRYVLVIAVLIMALKLLGLF